MKYFLLKVTFECYSEVGILRIINLLLEGVKKMPIKIIGKSILGELGFCQVPSKMGCLYKDQLHKIYNAIPVPSENHMLTKLAMTSMTGFDEREACNGEYFPKIREYTDEFAIFTDAASVYNNCKKGVDKFRPGCDFIVWDSKEHYDLAVATYSKGAPIIAFESDSGKKALGVILRQSLMVFGDYLFTSIKEYLGGNIRITLVSCNHFEYPTGSIPTIIQNLALKYDMNCVIGINSEEDDDSYHYDEIGNHVVVVW